MAAARNHTGKEQERMKRLRNLFNKMKYRYKLTILLIFTSLVPMTVLALYSHGRQSIMVRNSELEDMQSIMEQTKESIDSQTAVYTSLLNYLTYSPDIEEIIKEKDIDNYSAYEKYTEIARSRFYQYRKLIMMQSRALSCLQTALKYPMSIHLLPWIR